MPNTTISSTMNRVTLESAGQTGITGKETKVEKVLAQIVDMTMPKWGEVEKTCQASRGSQQK